MEASRVEIFPKPTPIILVCAITPCLLWRNSFHKSTAEGVLFVDTIDSTNIVFVYTTGDYF